MSPPSVSAEALIPRIERLEQALDASKTQVATLTSEVATLVRAIADIRKQSSRPPVTAAIPVGRGYVRPSWATSAIVAAAVGLGAAIVGWTYLASDGDTSIAAAAAATSAAAPRVIAKTAPVAAEPSAPAKAVPEALKPLAPAALKAPAPEALKAPEAPARQSPRAAKYVGTLSIDADPGGDVFLNRKSVGHTPLRLANLRAGSHLIWIERDGYRRFTRVVNVPADRVTRLSADLEPNVTR
jgi:PEGA domain